jgi:hypothetical protein
MKTLFTLFLSLAFFLPTAHASTYCSVSIEDLKSGLIGQGEIRDAKWSQWNKRVENVVPVGSWEKVRFTLETIMTNPDSGTEKLTILGQMPETCTSEFIYGPTAAGPSVFIGEKTTCQASQTRYYTVFCVN